MLRWANGDIYVGDWRQGRPHGHGEFKHDARGSKYVGQFVKGQKSGFGTEYYKDNSSFMGKFQVIFGIIFSNFELEKVIFRTVNVLEKV